MGVEVTTAEVGEGAVAAEREIAEKAAAAGPTSVPSTIKINGVERDAFTTTVGGKVIVHTAKLSVLEQRKLSRAVEAADEGKMAFIWDSVAATVRTINGDAIGFPATDGQIEAILIRLGDDAAEKLFQDYTAGFAKRMTDAKNSQSTPASA